MKDFLMWMAEAWYKHPLFKIAQFIAIGMGVIAFLGLLTGVGTAAAYFGCYSVVIFIFIYAPVLIHDSVVKSEQEVEFKIPKDVQGKLSRIDFVRRNNNIWNWKASIKGSDVIANHLPGDNEIHYYCSPRWFFRCFIEQEFFKCPFNIMDFPYDYNDMIKSCDRYDERWLLPIAYLLKKGERYNWKPIGDGIQKLTIREENVYRLDYEKVPYIDNTYYFYFDKKYIYAVADKYDVEKENK